MSGDQAETPMLASEIPAEEIDKIKILQTSARPTKITVTANGLEIQSNLNPNATEFFPSYLLNKTPLLKENIDDAIPENSIKIRQELFIRDAGKNVESKIEEDCMGILDAAPQNVRNAAKEQTNENIDDNLELGVGKNQLCLLFASSQVKNTSSENVRPTAICSETEKTLIENKKETNSLDGITYETILKNKNIESEVKENNLNREQVLLEENIKRNLTLANINEHYDTNPQLKDKIDEKLQACTTHLEILHEDDKEPELVYLFYKQNNTEMPNANKKPNESEVKEQTIKGGNISKEVKDPKKKIREPRVSRTPTPTLGKMSFSKIPKNVEPKKETATKAEAKVVQNSSLARNLKSNTPSKPSSPMPTKNYMLPAKKEVSRSLYKDTTTATKTAGSTEKSSTTSTTKSYLQSNKLKSTEKPVGHGLKPKEITPKSPRATVSSKLRKTETQKRRNLFFDLDTIKMSDFLFK